MARAMKPSGVEWIGSIPADWELSKIKHNFTVYSGATPKSEFAANWDGNIIWITPADYKTTDRYVSQGKRNISATGYNSCGTTLVPKGSIIFSKRAPIGTVAIAAVELCTNQGCLSCVPKADTDSGYYCYVMSAFTEQFNFYGTGTTFKEISYDVFCAFKVPRPPLDEQQRIAAFLDGECARIDSVVEKTRASIEEYRKLKQAIITRAVTKGIRPNRPTKDSGIDWLGDIPADWELAQLKRFVFVNNGRETLDEVDKTEDVVPVYGSGGVFKYTTTPLYSGETVMFGRKGTLGKPIYANEKLWTVDTMYFLTFSEKLFAKFNYYQLCAFDWEPHITQTALPSIVASEIVSCKFAFPPLDEQKEIAAYLDEKTAAIDSLVAKKNRLVSELESLKKSLIFEYVTGKKEVPK